MINGTAKTFGDRWKRFRSTPRNHYVPIADADKSVEGIETIDDEGEIIAKGSLNFV